MHAASTFNDISVGFSCREPGATVAKLHWSLRTGKKGGLTLYPTEITHIHCSFGIRHLVQVTCLGPQSILYQLYTLSEESPLVSNTKEQFFARRGVSHRYFRPRMMSQKRRFTGRLSYTCNWVCTCRSSRRKTLHEFFNEFLFRICCSKWQRSNGLHLQSPSGRLKVPNYQIRVSSDIYGACTLLMAPDKCQLISRLNMMPCRRMTALRTGHTPVVPP